VDLFLFLQYLFDKARFTKHDFSPEASAVRLMVEDSASASRVMQVELKAEMDCSICRVFFLGDQSTKYRVLTW
jgi:hypothetical protein